MRHSNRGIRLDLRGSSVDDWLQRGCIHLQGNVAVDELYCKDETEFAGLSNQPTFHAAHRTALNTDPLTFDQTRVRLGLALQKTSAEKLYLTIRQAKRLAAVAPPLAAPGGGQKPG